MNRAVLFWCLLSAMLFSGNPLRAQLNLHVNKQFLGGKKILKVETTWDEYVWVLGADNFIARISPDDEVEDFTAFFAGYSTKPFTDISSRSADTLLLGTDGDYAFLFANNNVRQFGPSSGVDIPTITGVVIPKQFFLPHFSYENEGYFPITLTAGWKAYGSTDFNHFTNNAEMLRSTPQQPVTTLWKQNDRKGYLYMYHYAKSHEWMPTCYGREISDFELFLPLAGGSGLQQAFVDQVGDNQRIRTAFYTPRVKLLGFQRPAFFWAGDYGLNFSHQTLNCFERSTPIPFFNDKQVTCITDVNALPAQEDYLSFLLVGTSTGLFVSSDNQKKELNTDYIRSSALGSLRINDMESANTGAPNEFDGHYGYDEGICEKWIYIGTEDGLFKMNYSIEPASYSHVGNTLYLNGLLLEDSSVDMCGNNEDILAISFFPDRNNFIRWQRDEQDIIDADTNFVYLTEPGVYRAVMWFGCDNIEIYSKEITVVMGDAPEFTFDYPDTVDICEGNTFPLEVKEVQPGYSYQWYRDGEVITGEASATFSVTEAGTYHVGVSACGDNFVFSDPVTVRFHQLEKPTSTDTDILVCEGQTGTITVTGYAPEVIKRWYRDGVLLSGESSTVLRVSEPGAYHVELAIGSCSVASDRLNVRIVPLPTAQIRAADDGPLCYGTSTTLTAVHPADQAYTYQWSTGETTRSIEVNNPGVYTLILTNASGCADATDFEVTTYDPVAVPHIRDTVICVADREMVRIEAPAGYAAYHWNGGVSSGPYFDVSAPGTYSLQVQDENGCTVSTTFEVRPHCEEIIIPNTFSPNGDGINDVWTIGGLEGGGDAVVTVFDRNGQIVFQSRGYNPPWDGLYKGQLVPVGAYYYHINTSWGAHYKGALTVLY